MPRQSKYCVGLDKHQRRVQTNMQCIPIRQMHYTLQNGPNPQMPKMQRDRSRCQLMLEIRLGIWQDEWALANTIHPLSLPTGRTGVKSHSFIARRTPTSSPKHQSPLESHLAMPFRLTQSPIHTQ